MRFRARTILLLLPLMGPSAVLAQAQPAVEAPPVPDNDRAVPNLPALVDSHGLLRLKQAAGLDRSLAGTKNPNTIMMGVGNRISFCPALSCIYGPPSGAVRPEFFDHQRASLLVSGASQDDGATQEQTLAVTTTIGTGYATPYKPRTAYRAGDNVNIGNVVYRAVQAGTSGAATTLPATRPDHLPFTVKDGSVVWEWINDSAINAKVGAYFETNVVDGAGAAWGAAFNYHINTKPRSGQFFPGVEFDYANDSGHDCAVGVTDCTAIRVGLAGNAQVTHGIQITGDGVGTTGYSSIWALRINGDRVASQSAIEVDAASPIGLGFGSSGIGGQSHSVATIQDVTAGPTSLQTAGAKTIADLVLGASGPRAIQITGARSSSAIEDTTTSPAALNIGGKKSLAAIRDGSTTPTGILLQGAYATAQISGPGWSVAPDGGLTAASVTEPVSAPPASSRAPCRVGQRAWDKDYEYRCVAANRWKRAALSDW
ncbi:MAG TPA: hypothetical protein K8W01_13010 [Methylorubrum populi]|uniref:Uncharacterized protein n=1 Tax=Methylorubrum populi TaxID=223967 RepID=A0A921E3A8_9HYPH|nr:hypothetical protein [Methylorubrum populi]